MPELNAHICRDMEQTAELFNNGYQEAMQHKTGGAEHRAWLIQVAAQTTETMHRTHTPIVHLSKHWIARCNGCDWTGSTPYGFARSAQDAHLEHLATETAKAIADAVLSEIDFGVEDADA